MSLHTAYKFAHYRRLPCGRRALIWTPSQGDIPTGRLIKGTTDWLAVMRAEPWVLNALVDEGEQAILESFFRNNHTPTFYFALYNDGAIAETDTLATLTNEVSGTGYARIAVARDTTDWGAAVLTAGDYQTTSATKTFSAGGTWTGASELALVSAASGTTGTFYAWAPLSATRTLVNGDTLDVSLAVKLA